MRNSGTCTWDQHYTEPVNAEQLLPGDGTYPVASIWYHELILSAPEQRRRLDFGWDLQLR